MHSPILETPWHARTADEAVEPNVSEAISKVVAEEGIGVAAVAHAPHPHEPIGVGQQGNPFGATAKHVIIDENVSA